MRPPLAITSVCLFLAASLAGEARAQRGTAYIQQDAAPATAKTGFPGLLDAEVAGDGEVVVGAPFLTVDYGLTENLTVGTNLWAAMPLAWGAPSALFHARYRLYTDDRLRSAFALYAGYLHGDRLASGGFDQASGALLLATSSTSVLLAERHQVTLSGFGTRFRVRVEKESGSYEETSLIAAGVAGSYAFHFSQRFSAEATLLTLPLAAIEVDNLSATATADLTSYNLAQRSFARLLVHRRFGSTWLLSGGVAAQLALPIPLPWLGLSWSL